MAWNVHCLKPHLAFRATGSRNTDNSLLIRRRRNRPAQGKSSTLDWYTTVFEVIDTRSFSNLWYWIILAVTWSSISHWVLGVPFDMVARARRNGGQAEKDLEDLVRINANRFLFIVQEAGLWMTALVSGILTALLILGIYYGVEFAQAIFLLMFPLTFVGLLSIYSARKVKAGEDSGDALWRRLRIHRMSTQMIGMVSIFLTAMWGMYHNLSSFIH